MSYLILAVWSCGVMADRHLLQGTALVNLAWTLTICASCAQCDQPYRYAHSH